MNIINELRFKCEIMWIDHSRKICFVVRTCSRIVVVMVKYLLMRIYHYSTYLTSWSWQKLYGDRKNGYGYKKRK